MTDREAMQQALKALEEPHEHIFRHRRLEAIVALKERLAQPEQEPVIDKSAAIRIATALGWVPPSDTSQDRVAEPEKQRQEQEPTVKWDASAPLVVTPHPAFQATLQPRKPWVGLTDEERDSFWKADQMTSREWDELFNAIEAKLREKNT